MLRLGIACRAEAVRADAVRAAALVAALMEARSDIIRPGCRSIGDKKGMAFCSNLAPFWFWFEASCLRKSNEGTLGMPRTSIFGGAGMEVALRRREPVDAPPLPASELSCVESRLLRLFADGMRFKLRMQHETE